MNHNQLKKQKLKEMIKKLHEGVPPEQVMEQFKQVIAGVDSEDIARVEEELIKEGMPRDEIRRLCEVHLMVFKESLEGERRAVPQDHPVSILMEEHKILLDYSQKLLSILAGMKKAGNSQPSKGDYEHIDHLVTHFKESEKHYLREENVLFPLLEKRGVTEPPKIMWMEHDEIRRIKKSLYAAAEAREGLSAEKWAEKIEPEARALADMLSNHFNKENSILFPTALKVVSQEEWESAREDFEEIGYCCFTPGVAKEKHAEAETAHVAAMSENMVTFRTGKLTVEELTAMLNALPVDISFVGKDDTVRYFSDNKDRIFVRTPAVIGRNVRQCHPQKSVEKVEKILNGFKDGTLDKAEFWINLKGRLVYIRYLPVKSATGEYLGCLEVTQDITDIKKIEGEKRLL